MRYGPAFYQSFTMINMKCIIAEKIREERETTRGKKI